MQSYQSRGMGVGEGGWHKKGGGIGQTPLEWFPFPCVPYMPVARDVIHRAVIEMVLPKHKDILSDERTSGWVQGTTAVSTDGKDRETIWFYRSYGHARKKLRRTVEEVRFFLMRRANTGGLVCLSSKEVQRAIGKCDWEVVRGILLWCAAVYYGKWTGWELPSWFVKKIWNSRISKERYFAFIRTLFQHLYVQIDGRLYSCWDVNEQKAVRNGRCTGLVGSWSKDMQEVVQINHRVGYGLLPWFVMRVWGREEFIGRMGVYIGLNDHPGGKYRIKKLLEGVLGGTEYQYALEDSGRWRRLLGKVQRTEEIMGRYGWDVSGGVGSKIVKYGYSQRISGVLVSYTKGNSVGLGEVYGGSGGNEDGDPLRRIT